jgi:hypothetical protein
MWDFRCIGPSSFDCVYNFSQASSQHKYTVQWPHTRLTTIYTRSCAALRGWDPPPYDRSNICSLIRGSAPCGRTLLGYTASVQLKKSCTFLIFPFSLNSFLLSNSPLFCTITVLSWCLLLPSRHNRSQRGELAVKSGRSLLPRCKSELKPCCFCFRSLPNRLYCTVLFHNRKLTVERYSVQQNLHWYFSLLFSFDIIRIFLDFQFRSSLSDIVYLVVYI